MRAPRRPLRAHRAEAAVPTDVHVARRRVSSATVPLEPVVVIWRRPRVAYTRIVHGGWRRRWRSGWCSAEDNVLVRGGSPALLDSYEDIEVVGVAQDAPTLMAAVAEHVLDVRRHGYQDAAVVPARGIDCAHAIRRDHPDTGVVVLSPTMTTSTLIAPWRRAQRASRTCSAIASHRATSWSARSAQVHAGGAVDPAIAGAADRAQARRRRGPRRPGRIDKARYADMALSSSGTTQEAVDRRVTELSGGWRATVPAPASWASSNGSTRRGRAGCSAKNDARVVRARSSSADRLVAHPETAISRRSSCVSVPVQRHPWVLHARRAPVGPRRRDDRPVATSRPWPRWCFRTAARSTSSRRRRDGDLRRTRPGR